MQLLNLRYTARVLARSPAFTVSAILCLGLGIGVTSSLFSIFNTLLWKPLPVADPGALVRVFAQGPERTRVYRNFSYPEYLDYRRENRALAGLVATTGVQAVLRQSGDEAARIFGEAVSADYFQMLGLRPQFGRFPAPAADGDGPGAPAELVIGHRLWHRRFGASPAVLGSTLWLSGVAFTVVGIAPEGFNGTYSSPLFAPDLWVPLGTVPLLEHESRAMFEDRSRRSLSLLGRVRSDASVGEARAAFDTIAARLAATCPDSNRGVTVRVFKELDTHPEVYSSRALNLVALLFLGLAGLVLVVACANLANLVLARATARRRELAVRLALGATRAHNAGQLLAEGVVLSLAAGIVGLGIAAVMARAVSSVRLPIDLPIVFEVAIDARVAAFTMAVSLLAGLAFSMLPAIRASRRLVVEDLKPNGSINGAARRRFSASGLLVGCQVAFSLVLLVATGLFWRSIAGVEQIDPGMTLDGRSLATFTPSMLHYDAERTDRFYRSLLGHLNESPAVEDAALAAWVPLGFNFQEAGLVVRGEDAPASGASGGPTLEQTALVNVVTPRFFEAAGVPIRRGRAFTDQDDAASAPVAIVNETLARRAWPGLDPIGRQLRTSRSNDAWLTVVGVVADGKYRQLTEAPQSYVLRPLAQRPTDAMTVIVKARGPHQDAVSAVRDAVRSIDPGMPLLDVKTMDQQMAKVRFVPQAMTALAGPAAGVALLIAAIGLYGVVAHSVARRRREFGIRLAIGAQAHDIVRGVMADCAVTVGAGLGLGLAAALAVGQLARRLLVGVAPTDPAVLLAAVALAGGIAIAAIYLPARRASRLDPLEALRQE
jgi:predicted permease